MLEPNDRQKRKDFWYGIGLGILYLVGIIQIMAIVFQILAVIIDRFYPTNLSNMYQVFFVILGIDLLILVASFTWIMYKLIKKKKWVFMKGFLVGSILVPLILIGACFGIMFLSS